MSVKIRLSKTGKKHQISFRITAVDTRSKRDGASLEILGYYNPKNKTPKEVEINHARYEYWLSKGAKPTATVAKIIQNTKHGRLA